VVLQDPTTPSCSATYASLAVGETVEQTCSATAPVAGGEKPDCAGVAPLTGDYAATVGREIVTPDRTDVLAVVPHRPELDPPVTARQHLLTLTTCHPRFSARERLVVHAVQVSAYDKREQGPEFRPPELAES
jgi:hypothetical protein